ncbi:MAG: ABC transporter permease [Spirochaetia bacterium]|nr:ABC transporter permease [Spirochaetia bacterium]
MVTVRALIVKEWIQTFRDKRMLLVIFVLPLIQMTIFGFAVSNEVKNLPAIVYDGDRSELSREIISALGRGGYFKITALAASQAESINALYINTAKIAFIIPPGFQKDVRSNRPVNVQIALDGSDGNAATIATGYALRILSELEYGNRIRVLPQTMLPFHGAVLDSRVWFNPSLESTYFLVPGIITMILTIITTILTAMGITKEKETGTFEQLVVSPIRGWELMLGKTLPYAVIGFGDAVLATAFGRLMFKVPIEGSLSALAFLNLAYVFAMLGMGLFISTVSATQQQAMMTVFGVLFRFIILSDFFFPLENMPVAVQYLTYLNPMKYCLTAQRAIFLKGAGWQLTYPNILVLFGFAAVFLGYGSIRFRRSLAS